MNLHFVFSFCILILPILCVYFYLLGRSVMFPDFADIALCRRHSLGSSITFPSSHLELNALGVPSNFSWAICFVAGFSFQVISQNQGSGAERMDNGKLLSEWHPVLGAEHLVVGGASSLRFPWLASPGIDLFPHNPGERLSEHQYFRSYAPKVKPTSHEWGCVWKKLVCLNCTAQAVASVTGS